MTLHTMLPDGVAIVRQDVLARFRAQSLDGKTFMMNEKQFESIKQKHGGYASWAVWAYAGAKPKSNMGDMSIFDLDLNPALMGVLQNDVIMVGLNISRPFCEPFRNFHDSNPRANDFKIRYAFQNTEYYGAYMTDIIKDFAMTKSEDMLRHLKAHPSLIPQNVAKFWEELWDLNSKSPTILAFAPPATDARRYPARKGRTRSRYPAQFRVTNVLPINPILDSQRFPRVPRGILENHYFIGENDDLCGFTNT